MAVDTSSDEFADILPHPWSVILDENLQAGTRDSRVCSFRSAMIPPDDAFHHGGRDTKSWLCRILATQVTVQHILDEGVSTTQVYVLLDPTAFFL